VKRIVFEDRETGINHIVGVWTEADGPHAVTAGPGELNGRIVPFVSLVRVTPRALFYREPLVPRSYGSMDPR
jgi:hypothetical protein